MALTYQKEIDSHTSFAIWRIEESVEHLEAQLQLKRYEEEFLQSIHHDKRKLHWLGARVLLKTLLNTNEYIDCRPDNQGKPFLVNHTQHISISHSFDYAAAMICTQSPVGIDIERIDPKIVTLAPKFLSAEELSFIDQTDQVEQLHACWSAKEAIYKLHGKRGVSLLKDIQLKPFAYRQRGEIVACLSVNNRISSFIAYFEKFEEYMVSYAAGCF